MKAEKVLSEPGLKSVAGTALLGNLTQNTKYIWWTFRSTSSMYIVVHRASVVSGTNFKTHQLLIMMQIKMS